MALTSVSTKYFLHFLYTNLEKKKKLISTYQNIIEDLEFLEGQALYVFRDTHYPSNPFLRLEYSSSMDCFMVLLIQTCAFVCISCLRVN